MSTVPRRAFATVATIGVVAAVVAGMIALGSPGEQRARRLDERRLEDLRAIGRALDLLWTEQQRLPRSLDELPPAFAGNLRDPETGAPYEYTVLGEKRYQLCAAFDRESADRDSAEAGRRVDAGWDRLYLTFFSHGPGRHCFESEVTGYFSRDDPEN